MQLLLKVQYFTLPCNILYFLFHFHFHLINKLVICQLGGIANMFAILFGFSNKNNNNNNKNKNNNNNNNNWQWRQVIITGNFEKMPTGFSYRLSISFRFD